MAPTHQASIPVGGAQLLPVLKGLLVYARQSGAINVSIYCNPLLRLALFVESGVYDGFHHAGVESSIASAPGVQGGVFYAMW